MDILRPQHLRHLLDFAGSNVLVAFDYDGTLAPVVADPRLAHMRPLTRRLLVKVARRYPCVVISGRANTDIVSLLAGVPLSHVFSNHGYEAWAQDGPAAATVRTWIPTLANELRDEPGVIVENKTYSVTIHYRLAQHRQTARRAIAKAVSGLTDVRLLGGDEAVNLLVRGAPDKGDALQRARRAFGCDTAIYIGNDATDETAFVSAPPDQILSIRVGASRASRAAYRLGSQRQIDRLLARLLDFRPARRRVPPLASRAKVEWP